MHKLEEISREFIKELCQAGANVMHTSFNAQKITSCFGKIFFIKLLIAK